jgi:deazaflavin-dependent oxidoreductase (nitroreductase family)
MRLRVGVGSIGGQAVQLAARPQQKECVLNARPHHAWFADPGEPEDERRARITQLEVTDMAIRVSPAGTRGTRIPKPLLKLFKPMGSLMIRRYRRSAGAKVSARMGFPVVLLTTRGARTGRTRTTPVGGFPDGEDSWLVVASLAGAARHPDWFFNMAKHPSDIWLEVGKRRFKVRAQTLDGLERADALARIGAIAPRYGTYQQKTDREIPVVRLTRQPA